MRILAVDDHAEHLDALLRELEQVFPTVAIHTEHDPCAAARWSESLCEAGETLDYAFLAVCMHGMSGIELARHIKALHPRATVIFCTAHPEYAYDAFTVYAKGYLIKPVTADDIIEVLDEMAGDWRQDVRTPERGIRVRTFGHFEVFADGKPLVFERSKAKELLAYLIDRHGASITTEQIAAVLWEDRSYDRTLKNYVATVYASLRNTLRAVGAENILIKTRNHLSIAPDRIRCDAYEFERQEAGHVFCGAYMTDYAWAEFTTGRYISMENERKK